MEEKDNSWYERGELPPVGAECEYTTTEYQESKPAIEVGKWYFGKIIAYYDGFVWTSDNGIRRLCITKFRPLRTEREKFIDAVKRFHNISHVIDADAYFGGLYDAGFRAPESK